MVEEHGHIARRFLPFTKASRVGARCIALIQKGQRKVMLVCARESKFGEALEDKIILSLTPLS